MEYGHSSHHHLLIRPQIRPAPASSVNSAVKGLLDKGLLTCNRGEYQVYDLFPDIYIRDRYLK